MINVRNKIFETNSSSIHSVCISTKEPTRYPKKIVFRQGDYDSTREDLTRMSQRASYLYELIMSNNDYDADRLRYKLEKFLDSKNIEYQFPKKHTYGYIGHGPEIHEIARAIIENEDLLNRFLFSNDSFVQIGHDCDEKYVSQDLKETSDENYTVFVKNN